MTSPSALARFDAIVIGASAGGTAALAVLLPALPDDLQAAVFVVLHQPRDRPSLLVEIFTRRCGLPVTEAQDKEPIAPGTVYFAPPDYHVLIEEQRSIALSVDPPVQFARPSIDVLFESAAAAYGERVLGILLTGANADGALGLRCIRAAGGSVIVQDPAEADMPFMPAAGLQQVPDADVLTLQHIASYFNT